MFLHSAVSSPLDHSNSFTLHPVRPVHAGNNKTSLGSIQTCCNDYEEIIR